MSVGNSKKYDIAKNQTFMGYDFIHNKMNYFQVNILVPSMGRDNFGPRSSLEKKTCDQYDVS